MTYGSAGSKWAAYCKLLGMSGVLAASLTVGAASGQQERSSRTSDRSSEQDESTRSRDEYDQADRASRSTSNQSDQQRRRSSDSENYGEAQNYDREQDRSSQNRYQQDTQFGQRSQRSGQGQSFQNQYGQQGRVSQGQTTQGRYQPGDRSAASNRSRESFREDQYGTQRGSQGADSAWLGVYLRDSQTEEAEGAQVAQVYPAGPAARAGLRAGDVITAVDGEQVSSAEELIKTIEEHQPGARAQLSLTRNNQQVELPITLGSRQSFAWNRSGEDQGSGQGGYATSSRSGNEDFRSGHSGEDDYWSNVPPFAMQLEHERRMYEQHQRIETQIAKLQDEIRQLREELRQRR
jgi:C-terminal processing protease CtpA/Prc